MDLEKQVIRYLDGEMKGEEIHRFEKELKKDPDLMRLVEQIQRLQDLAGKAIASENDPEIRLDEKTRSEIRRSVRDFKEKKDPDRDVPGDFTSQVREAAAGYKKRTSERPGSMQIIWYGLAAAVIVAALLSVFLLRPLTRMSPAEIYAEHLKPIEKEEGVAELTRSDDDFLFAVKVYESGDFERAAVLFQMLTDNLSTKDYAMLYLGHSYMNLNRMDDAIEAFESLLNAGSGELTQDAKWYLSLCYLKKGMTDKAGELLEEIRNSGSPYTPDAKKILRSLR